MARTTRKININSRIREHAIHGPISKATGELAYIKYEDIKGMDVSVLPTCNSATNIRRIFVTHNKVIVEYYRGYHRKGGSTSDVIRQHDWNIKDNEVTTMMQLCEGVLNGKYYNDENPFAVMAGTYTCNNIEEIYFDWSFMICGPIRNMLLQQGGPDGFQQLLATAMNTDGHLGQARLIENTTMAAILVNGVAEGKDIKYIRRRYPRLHTVGLISNLSDYINNRQSTLEAEYGSQDKYCKSLLDENNSFFLQNAQSIASQSLAFISRIPGCQKDTLIVKDEQYAFDKYFLSKTLNSIEKFKEQQKEEIEGQRAAEVQAMLEEEEQPHKYSKFEKALADLSEKYGDAFAENAFVTSMNTIISSKNNNLKLKDYKEEINNNFSKDNKDKYKRYVGL